MSLIKTYFMYGKDFTIEIDIKRRYASQITNHGQMDGQPYAESLKTLI